MARLMHRGASSLLILALLFCPPVIGGSIGEKIVSVRKAGGDPAGTIESLGTIRVDGRIAQTGAMLWGHELLQAPAIESAQLKLNEIGLISLRGGSTIKLASILTEARGASSPRILFAYLVAGEMMLKLNDQANARICAGNSIFVLSSGSSARVLVSEGRGRILSSNGEVKETTDWYSFRTAPIAINQDGAQMTPGEYKIQPYNFSFSLGGYADIEARSMRYLQFRVTDKDDKPAPDLVLLFLLKKRGGSSDVGSINYGATETRVTTDHNGVATVRFDASVITGAIASFEAVIVKNNQVLTGNIRIIQPKGFWTMKNAGPVMATAVTTVAVAFTAYSLRREIPQRPPVIAIDSVVIQ